ncbi:NUDIX domain-containing protein [Fontisphaera persica]|uniref:NUDIX hydrolase n=1 Tax=Fontisphaera persica TaxID=2974023 RepID=UPI0024C0B19B|nr:NUDIX domain-containing protein [Fontisphaera persica]WCJ60057.1 NUDIX domain-containing protein [Fontisphaera persica]
MTAARLPLFVHCPRCGAAGLTQPEPDAYACGQCGFHYHTNPAVGVGGLVVDNQGRLLLLRRANDPGRGKYGLPGGFVNPGESAEEALVRETREETGLEIQDLRFVCTAPNVYPYRGVTYHVLDIFFAARAAAHSQAAARAEVDSLVWLHPHELNLEDIAFLSVRRAVSLFRDPSTFPRQ